MSGNKYYSYLPFFIQNFIISSYGFYLKYTRFNSNFKKELIQYNHKAITNKNDLLKKFLVHSNYSKFYNEIYTSIDFNFQAEDLEMELKKMPILTKESVKKNLNSIKIDSKYLKNSKISKVSTSGTTGSGLVFWQTREMENKQWAIWWRYRIRNGIKLNTWCAWFGGTIVVPISELNPPFWRINYPGKQVMFSGYHLNRTTAPLYFKKLKSSRISWIHGYPSQIALLASYCNELNLGDLPDLKIITYGSENMMDYQSELISNVFKVPIRSHYGLAEGVANISQHSDGSFHVDDDFCYVEFIPTEEPERYRIIGTNFSNFAFPLIRYDTGDIAVIKIVNDKKNIIRIDGRSDDYIVRADGVKISRLGFLFKDQVFVSEAQIFQVNLQTIIFRIVPMKGYLKSVHEQEILKNAKERLGETFDYSFEYLDSIPKTANGKLKYVLSSI